ncbi:hypothetical protein DVH24_010969 [Malus domestica]|uniref:Uncharacterized protein n=1 Tax=Malus domestica TaxID=3750 RepID=A0A498JXY7_MALDO|nr:hypothetical protein DVH24_010969 [Malus domestica]
MWDRNSNTTWCRMTWGYTFSTSLSDFSILRSTGDPRPLLIDVSDVDGSLVSSFAGDSMFSISGPFIALSSAHVSDLAHRAQTRMEVNWVEQKGIKRNENKLKFVGACVDVEFVEIAITEAQALRGACHS